MAHLLTPPPRTPLPPPLDRALRRLLAKRPEDRLGLKAFLRVLAEASRPNPSRR